MNKNNEYVTVSDCLVFCNVLGYKISERQLRNIISDNIEFKKNKANILVNKKQFSSLILEKYKEKSKRNRKNNK